ESAPQKEQEGENNGNGSDESQFFSDDRVNEVGVGLGQIKQLLDPVGQSNTVNAAGSKSDQRLDDLKAAFLRVGFRIQESEKAFATIGNVHHQKIEGGQSDPAKSSKPSPGHSGEEEESDRDTDNHDSRAQVRFDHHKQSQLSANKQAGQDGEQR